jgi:metal-dependent amidase/aminoacylase/carboxypeptidase family protein
VRTFDKDVQRLMVDRMRAIVEGTAAMMGGSATLTYNFGYPATINSDAETEFACRVAAGVVGQDRVKGDIAPTMGGEDFSYMLQKVPGSYFYIGNGDSAGLHHPKYNFNDEAGPVGASVFARIVETAQPLG